jgi:hypothetical protein
MQRAENKMQTQSMPVLKGEIVFPFSKDRKKGLQRQFAAARPDNTIYNECNIQIHYCSPFTSRNCQLLLPVIFSKKKPPFSEWFLKFMLSILTSQIQPLL